MIKLSKKYLQEGIKDYVKKKEFGLSEIEITNLIKSYLIIEPQTYKNVDEDRKPNWIVIYAGNAIIEMKISDKTGKLINFELRNFIE